MYLNNALPIDAPTAPGRHILAAKLHISCHRCAISGGKYAHFYLKCAQNRLYVQQSEGEGNTACERNGIRANGRADRRCTGGNGGMWRAGTIKKETRRYPSLLCDPNRIQTCNLRIRSAMLYSVKLWDRGNLSIADAKVRTFRITAKFFEAFLRKKLQFIHNLLFDIWIHDPIYALHTSYAEMNRCAVRQMEENCPSVR